MTSTFRTDGINMANPRQAYGITGFGGYVPRLRMERSAIAAAHRWMAPSLRSLSKGRRSFCSWDEDSVTMAVEAARDALPAGRVSAIDRLVFASTTMPFADLQNAAIIAGALNLRQDIQTLDIGQSQRAGTSALVAALRGGDGSALVVASDRPRGKPASTQEIGLGAGAAAFSMGSDSVLATLEGSASSTALFVDHFRPAEGQYDYHWEERWVRDEGYMKIVPPVVRAALGDAGLPVDAVKHFVLPTLFKGVVAALVREIGLPAGAAARPLDEDCGFCGAAHGLLMLANVLETAVAGDVILLVGFGQGCDVLVLRVTEAIAGFRPKRGVGGALADSQACDDYLRMLSYEDGIDLEWGMRGEKAVKTAFTEQYRSSDQLGGFMAGRCQNCGTVQFPRMPYCANPQCAAPQDRFVAVSLADVPASVLTYTADWLSYHPAPPLYVGFVQFENGARVLMEMVDVGANGVDTGMPLRAVFRIKDVDKTRRYPRYFWKMTPIQAPGPR
jgi:3-hydroxy-3-methylglutaryl CoA synthase